MDLKGSLVNTKLKIYPTKTLLEFINKIPNDCKTPLNIAKLIKESFNEEHSYEIEDVKQVQLNDQDIVNLNNIKDLVLNRNNESEEINYIKNKENGKMLDDKHEDKPEQPEKELLEQSEEIGKELDKETKDCKPHLTTLDIDWLYNYIQSLKESGEKDVPYLHTLLKGTQIEIPENNVIKRNPVLEARCVKLRAQQEARDYRKMTKSVDNVRMRFPDDSISYQCKYL